MRSQAANITWDTMDTKDPMPSAANDRRVAIKSSTTTNSMNALANALAAPAVVNGVLQASGGLEASDGPSTTNTMGVGRMS